MAIVYRASLRQVENTQRQVETIVENTQTQQPTHSPHTSWMIENNYGPSLSMAEIHAVMCDEFRNIRKDNEFLYTDYDVLALHQECGVDVDESEEAITDACCGQCLIGAGEPRLRQSILFLTNSWQFARARVLRATIGHIYLYASAITANLIRVFGDVTEITVRRAVRMILGHERQHSVQGLDFLLIGRSHAQAQLLRQNCEEVHSGNIGKNYMAIPSEVDADRAGFAYVMSFEQSNN